MGTTQTASINLLKMETQVLVNFQKLRQKESIEMFKL